MGARDWFIPRGINIGQSWVVLCWSLVSVEVLQVATD